MLDDIIHPDPYTYSCMQRLWNNIEFIKLDLTKYAHFSGTGCVFMNTNINIVIDEKIKNIYYSQCGEDEHLNTHFFKNKKMGLILN